MLLVVLSSSAFALQPDVSREVLEAHADLIVVGEVTSSEARWAAGHPGGIETVVWVAVDQVQGGEAVKQRPFRGHTVEITQEGGVLGEHRTVASDTPTLRADRRYRLLLARDGDQWRVLGGERGAEQLSGPLAYELTGLDWAWQERPVEDGFLINLDSFPAAVPSAELMAAWSTALDIWNAESGAPLYLPNLGTTTDLTFGGGDNDHNVTMYHSFTASSALASAIYNSVGGDLVDCDIRFYGANIYGTVDWSLDPAGAAPGRYDFVHTAVHEMGHCIGLAHSDDSDAIMYAYNTDGTGWERRHLHADDQAAIQHLYGLAELDLLVTVEADGEAGPGDVLEVQVSVTNASDVAAVKAVLSLSGAGATVEGGPVELGDVPPTETADATLTVTVPDDCAEDELVLEAVVEDFAERVFSGVATISLDCPVATDTDTDLPEDTDEPVADEADESTEAKGCGCSSAPAGGSLWLPLLLLWLPTRRR